MLVAIGRRLKAATAARRLAGRYGRAGLMFLENRQKGLENGFCFTAISVIPVIPETSPARFLDRIKEVP